MLHSYQKPLNGKNVGVVFGSFAPLHTGHLDIIMRAKKENDGGCLVIVCGYAGDKGYPNMPLERRYRYVREYFANDDMVAVYSINDDEFGAIHYPDGWPYWMKKFNDIWNDALTMNSSFTAHRKWYVGEESYALDLKSMFHEDAILVDRKATNPISATMIRSNPLKYWNKIAGSYKRLFSHNILICGTASEGKTTLTQDIGKYFNIPYSVEWARGYMDEKNVADWELGPEDYIAFLEGQYNMNQELINSPLNPGIMIADSDSMVTKMYAEYYKDDATCALTKEGYDLVAATADALTAKSRWNKIFLLKPNGVFVDDHTRFMNHSGMKERQELFNLIVKNIKESGNWDKVTVLNGGEYYNNFIVVKNYIEGVLANGTH